MTCNIFLIHCKVLFVILSFDQERMFQFWFNTFFISQQATDVEKIFEDEPTLKTVRLDTDLCYFDIGKEDLDKAHKDAKEKIFNRDFKVRFKGVPMCWLYLP